MRMRTHSSGARTVPYHAASAPLPFLPMCRRMFVLAELQYIIRVEPRRFGKDMKKEIVDELNRKFANKV